MSGQQNSRGGVIQFLVDNSLLLIFGAVSALIWANAAHQNLPDSGSQDSGERVKTSYQEFVEFDVRRLWGDGESHASLDATSDDHADHSEDARKVWGDDESLATNNEDEAGETHADVADHASVGKHGDSDEHGSGGHHHWYTLSFIVNDVLMALFFAIAAKEVWESLLPGGALSNPRKAATPLLATLGGILGPVAFYLAGAFGTGTYEDLGNGWAVPCATDIAFSYLIARMIFGGGHPAIAFLLLLAIADDAAGLIILAVAYPSAPIEPIWLALTAGAIAMAWTLRKFRFTSHWIYFLGPGILSWFSFYEANIHPALGLVPIIPMLPSAESDLGIFAREELHRDDTLNAFEHFWKTPVEIFLGLFGLVNAGVVLSSVGPGTWIVLAGLLIGKPVGITLMTLLAEKVFRLEKPAGMDYRHIVTLGMIAGIGFTVALFVSVAAFREPGPIQDSVKMGALLSFAAAPIAIVLAKALGVRPNDHETNEIENEGEPLSEAELPQQEIEEPQGEPVG
ncbi:MAG: Na+/H+ antiporter NhaA [Planctomycetota bacterium]